MNCPKCIFMTQNKQGTFGVPKRTLRDFCTELGKPPHYRDERDPYRCLQQGKGKAIPLRAWSGPEGSRTLRFPDFVTTAQNGGKVVSLTHRPPLPPGNTPGTHFC